MIKNKFSRWLMFSILTLLPSITWATVDNIVQIDGVVVLRQVDEHFISVQDQHHQILQVPRKYFAPKFVAKSSSPIHLKIPMRDMLNIKILRQ